jgi:hypothetical protein
MQAIRNNNSSTGYSSHALNTGHGIRTDVMEVIRTQKRKAPEHIAKIPM